MTRIPHLVLACAVAACLAAVSPALAQQTGRLAGSVRDIGGQAIKGASIRVQNPGAIPSEFNVATNQKGLWGVLGLQPGIWEITAGAPGYENSSVRVRVSVLIANPELHFVLVGKPPRGALEDVDTKVLQKDLSAAEEAMAAERWDDAIRAYKAILEKAPPLTTINLALGRALRMKKDYPAAAAAYNALLAADARNQRALLELGRCRHESGDRAAAVAALETLLAIDAETSEAEEARALLEQLKK